MTQKITIKNLEIPRIPNYDSDSTLVFCDGKLVWRRDIPEPIFQGNTSGYVSASSPIRLRSVDKWPFASDANATCVGNFTTLCRSARAPANSSTDAYVSGGSPPYTTCIEKFPFANETSGSGVGDLSCAVFSAGGITDFLGSNGYVAGGKRDGINPPTVNIIQKYAFSTGTTCVSGCMVGSGPLSSWGAFNNTGTNSTENGYTTHRPYNPTNVTAQNKFPFAADANATCLGNLPCFLFSQASISSCTDGYQTGGTINPGTAYGVIYRHPFSSDTAATNVASLLTARDNATGSSSTTCGYTAGGIGAPNIAFNNIERFPFSTLSPSVSVGNLSADGFDGSGHQV